MVNKLAQCKKLIAESEKGFSRPTISHYKDKENGMKAKLNITIPTTYQAHILGNEYRTAKIPAETVASWRRLKNIIEKEIGVNTNLGKQAVKELKKSIALWQRKTKNPSTKTTIKKTFTKRTVTKNPSYASRIAKLQSGTVLKSELQRINRELQTLIKESKSKYADKEYYTKRITELERAIKQGLTAKNPTKTRANYSDFDFDFDKQFGKLSKMFQGKANGEKRKILASDLQPNKTVRIGELKKLIVNGLDGKQYEINFDGEAFASMDRRKGLWFSGKDSRLQLRNNNIKDDEMKCLGHLAQINYVTKKAHIENGEIVEYYHKFGEVNREKPTIWCDSDGFLIVNGGDYDIWKEGIVN